MGLWFCVLVFAILANHIGRIRASTLIRKHQFRLYALRDGLREAAICGQVNPNNWVYQYLDSSVAKTITYLDRLTIWVVLLTFRRAGAEAQLQAAHQHLMRALEKPANAVLKQFHIRYQRELIRFLLERHLPLRFVVGGAFRLVSAVQAARNVRARLRAAIAQGAEFQTEAPETSTLYEYHAAA